MSDIAAGIAERSGPGVPFPDARASRLPLASQVPDLWPVAAVALFGTLLTVLALWWLDALHQAEGKRNFEAEVQRIARRVESRMDAYATLLTAGTSLIGISDDVSRADWRELVANLDLPRNYPGALSYAYAERVPAAGKAAFEQSMRATFDPAFSIYPPQAKPDYYPALFAEPETAQRRKIIGFDLMSETVRQEAMRQAVHSNLPVLSGPIVRLNASGDDLKPTVILFAPVYQRHRPTETPDQRSDAVRGFVFAVFRIDNLLRGMFGEREPQVAFELFDQGRNGAFTPIFTCCRRLPAAEDRLAATKSVQVGERIWTLKFAAPARFGVVGGELQKAAIGAAGALITALATLVMWLMLRMRLRAESLAARMTADLERSRRRFERMVAGTNDGVWEFEAATRICYLSPRFAELLGYPSGEIDRPADWVYAQVHEDDRIGGGEAFVAMLRTHGEFDRKMRIRSRDGGYRWYRVRGRAFDSDGKLTAAGSMSDIQAEHEAAEREARLLSINELSPDVVMTIDPDGSITYMNGTAQRILGVTGDPGKPGKSAVSAVGMVPGARIASRMPRVAPASARDLWQGETSLTTAAGDVLPVSQVIVGHRDGAGRMVYYSTVMRDISRVRRAELELKRHRDDLAGLVVERTRGLELARQEAERARRAAEDANRAKSEFLTNMSHELRTPLHAILSFADFGLGRIGQADRDKLMGYFRNIQTSGNRLLNLLNDLLDLAKLEAGKMEMHRSPVRIAGVLQEAVTETGALAQSRGLRLTLTMADGADGMQAHLDAPRILQVVRNLLSNAIKFSPAGSTVELALAPARQDIEGVAMPGFGIAVRDAGIGIPEAELSSVFDKFVQSSKTKTGAGGTGLGLAICREIVGAHGGSIHATNNAPAPGTTFSVWLPQDCAAAAPVEGEAPLAEPA